MAAMRSQEDILSGVLSVVVGGSTRRLPTLKIRAAREWKARLATVLAEAGAVDVDFSRPESISFAASIASDKILGLVLEYDQSGALGGREWMEENADDAEVYAIFRALLGISYPFVDDLRSALAQIGSLAGAQVLLAATSTSPNSTNGHSPTGDSILTVSSPG